MKVEVLEKAKRLVEEDKIKVEKVTSEAIIFKVQGDSGLHTVIFDRLTEKWNCDCDWFQLRKVEGSHILACKLWADKLVRDGSSPLWDLQVKFIPQSKARPTKTLLTLALEKLGLTWDQVRDRVLEDDYGVFAINLDNGVLVAKDYKLRGRIVSCHRRALVSAYNQRKPLLMYLAEDDCFYEFSPREIMGCSFQNYKGTALMENFDISLGRKRVIKE